MVEYECIPQKASDGIAYPVPEVFATKGTVEGSFNEPMLADQWHFINQGNKKYSKTAVKGADVNVKDVWSRLTCGDPEIIVAVVDEAVCYTNPDLAANMWVNEGELNVGDDIMQVLIGADIRPHAVKCLETLVGRIKNECVTEKELYAEG